MSEPGRGPGPIAQSELAMLELLAASQFGVLASRKRDGTPHLATMVYAWDPDTRILRFSSVDDRVKPRHFRADPRGALHVSTADHMKFAVAEGTVEVTGSSTAPGDDVGLELLSMQPAVTERDRFLQNMVEDRRVVIRLHVDHLYGGGLAV